MNLAAKKRFTSKTAIIDLEQQRKQCHKTIWQYVAVWKKQQQQ